MWHIAQSYFIIGNGAMTQVIGDQFVFVSNLYTEKNVRVAPGAETKKNYRNYSFMVW